MTNEARRKAIQEALQAFSEDKGARETETLAVGSERLVLPVVSLRISVPLLNPYSHRIKAQLQEDPDYALVDADPWTEAAQNVLERLIKERHRQFAELKASLRVEGQRDAGVITSAGVLVNANTRLAALRELASPDRQRIRVAVLPGDISSSQPDILEIETSLQVQRELKDPYSLVNELLLIEELALGEGRQGRSHDEIARLMRYNGATSESAKERKQAAREVDENLRLLEMIRRLASLVPGQPLPLTLFDAGESARERRQPLIEVLRRHDESVQTGGWAVADQFAREWLLAFLAGAGAVHKARLIEPGWVDRYVVEELRDDERFSERVDMLPVTVTGESGTGTRASDGLELLDDNGQGEREGSVTPALLKIVAAARISGGAVQVPGGDPMDAAEVRAVMTGAVLNAISAKERDDRDERASYAPIEHVKAARSSVRKATDAYERANQGPDFNRSNFQLALKRLRKDVERLEQQAYKDSQTTPGN